MRKKHPNLRRRHFYQDRSIRNSIVKDIAWFASDGHEMTEEEWNSGWIRSIAVLFNGETLDCVDEMGQPLTDDTFLILINSYHDAVAFTLPPTPNNRSWHNVVDTGKSGTPVFRRAGARTRPRRSADARCGCCANRAQASKGRGIVLSCFEESCCRLRRWSLSPPRPATAVLS